MCACYNTSSNHRRCEDSIVRSIRAFGINSFFAFDEPDKTLSHDEIRKEFLANGSLPTDYFEEETILGSCKEIKVEKRALFKRLSPPSPNYIKESLYESVYFKKMPQKGARSIRSTTLMENRCVFCSNNNEPLEVVKSHTVRDNFGRVLCPKLRTYVCPICNSSGDLAHTVKYCPKKPVITMEDAIMLENQRNNDLLKKFEKFR